MDDKNDKNFLQTVAAFLAGFGLGKTTGQTQNKKKGHPLLIAAVVILLLIIFWPSGSDKTYSRIQWPDNELASLIPTPKLKAGYISYDSETYLHIEVKINQKEFNAYVESCRESGFTMDYYRDNDTYQAKDKFGNYLWLSYDSKEHVLGIHLDRAKEDDPEASPGEDEAALSAPEPSESGQELSPALTETKAATPLSSADCMYKNYLEIVPQFEQAGFTDVRTEAVPDMLNGWLVEVGDVKEVWIGEETSFQKNEIFEKIAPVIVRYHTYPEPEQSDEPQQGQNDPAQQETLTVDNCEALASMLTLKAEIDPAYSTFASAYKDRTIEFDGCITYITNNGDYNTRYDILLSAGDYVDEETANPGPIFKFEDVNTTDLGIEDLFLPEFVKVGTDVHITAKVLKFDSGSGLFFLDPVFIEAQREPSGNVDIDKWIGKSN